MKDLPLYLESANPALSLPKEMITIYDDKKEKKLDEEVKNSEGKDVGTIGMMGVVPINPDKYGLDDFKLKKGGVFWEGLNGPTAAEEKTEEAGTVAEPPTDNDTDELFPENFDDIVLPLLTTNASTDKEPSTTATETKETDTTDTGNILQTSTTNDESISATKPVNTDTIQPPTSTNNAESVKTEQPTILPATTTDAQSVATQPTSNVTKPPQTGLPPPKSGLDMLLLALSVTKDVQEQERLEFRRLQPLITCLIHPNESSNKLRLTKMVVQESYIPTLVFKNNIQRPAYRQPLCRLYEIVKASLERRKNYS